MSDNHLPCRDCQVHVDEIGEFGYMVTKEVWQQAAPDDTHSMDYYLCISCLERRLGKKLIPSDFPPDIPMNCMGMFKESKNLRSRRSVVE